MYKRNFKTSIIEWQKKIKNGCICVYSVLKGNRGLMVRESDLQPKGYDSFPAVIVDGGVNVQRSLLLNTTTEVPLSKAPNPQLLPGCRSIDGPTAPGVCVHSVCVFTAVCVHFGWVNCIAQITSMGHHTWPYFTSLSLSFTFIYLSQFVVVERHDERMHKRSDSLISINTQTLENNINPGQRTQWNWRLIKIR